jgi:hypothetical protein
MKKLCSLDRASLSKEIICEIPSGSAGIVYSKAIKKFLCCDPEAGGVWRIGLDGSKEPWFGRMSTITAPRAITLFQEDEVAVVMGEGDCFAWAVHVVSGAGRPLVGKRARSYRESFGISPKDPHQAVNSIARLKETYLVCNKSHRIFTIKKDSSLTAEIGSGMRGFSMTSDPAVMMMNSPSSICGHKDSSSLFIADTGNKVVRKMSMASGAKCTAIYGMPEEEGHCDGKGTTARFTAPTDMSCDKTHVAVIDGPFIRTIELESGEVETVYESDKALLGLSLSSDSIYFSET